MNVVKYTKYKQALSELRNYRMEHISIGVDLFRSDSSRAESSSRKVVYQIY